MAASQMSEVIQHLCRAVLLRDGAGLTDEQLLEDYISRRDEAALAALVRRHGPMIWGCAAVSCVTTTMPKTLFKRPSSSSSARRRPSLQGSCLPTGSMGLLTRRR